MQELLDKKHFKTYDELKRRLEKAIGVAETAQHSNPFTAPEEAPAPAFRQTAAPAAATAPSAFDDDEDEDLSFFKKLAKD